MIIIYKFKLCLVNQNFFSEHYCLFIRKNDDWLFPAIVIEIKRVDMNKPVDILNKNIESISLFDMKGLSMVLPR